MSGNTPQKTHLAEIGNYDPDLWDKAIPRRCFIDRDATLLDLCRNQKVLHLGAADYPFHEQSAKEGNLLHQKLQRVARSLVGIDQNREAVEYLRKHHGIDNIIHADTTSQINDQRLSENFDIILCCDIIEHVDNPGMLLEFCKQYLSGSILLVITTINATSIKNALRALQGREAVHQDHVAYYSYSTLCQLLLRHGLKPEQAGFFSYGTRLKSTGMIFRLIATISPGTADGILIVCKGRHSP